MPHTMTAIARRAAIAGTALAMSALLSSGHALADKPTKDPQPSAQAQPRQTEAPGVTIDEVALAMLVKSSLIAVQHANATGNYSVLRDLGTPIFRERFDQATLTAVFANLRARGINLSPVLILLPLFTQQPVMTAQGQLHVVGNFPTQPLQIRFELMFLHQDGIWRLDGLAVDAVPASTAAASPDGPGSNAVTKDVTKDLPGVPAEGKSQTPAQTTKKAEAGTKD